MNLSDTSVVVTIVLGAFTVTAWLWRRLNWFLASYAQAKENAKAGKVFAQQLISHATSAEKRADIHLYLLAQTIEASARRTQSSVRTVGVGLVITILGLFLSVAYRLVEISYSDPFVILTIAAFIAMVLSFSMAIWFSFIIGKLDDGWNEGFKIAIQQKIDKHLPDDA